MKHISIYRKLMAVAGCVALFCASNVGVSFAAQVATVTSSAKVVAAMTADATNKPLDFGQFANTAGGTIEIATGADTGTFSTGLTQIGNTTKRGIITITGDSAATYLVSLAATTATLSDGATHTLALSDLALSASSVTGSASTDVYVGGTLTVGDTTAAPPGTYSGTFLVNVDYQ